MGFVSAFFETALEAPLVSSQLLRSYAECLMRFASKSLITGRHDALLASEMGVRIETLFRKAVRSNPRDAETRFSYAKWRELCGDQDGARLHFLQSIMLTPQTLLGAADYLRLLKKLQMSKEATAFESVLFKLEAERNQ